MIKKREGSVTVFLALSMAVYKHFAKKKVSPIMLIVLSAVVGVAVYGI